MAVFLLSHAATAAMRRGAFPADDALDARGIAATAAWPRRGQVAALLEAAPAARVLCSPARCAQDTAQALALTLAPALAPALAAAVEPALADVDYGRWRGLELAQVAANEPAPLAAWLGDAQAAPHSGESFGAAVRRVGAWLDAIGDGDHAILAITHAAVVRAAIVHALGAPPSAFFRIEIAPLALVELRRARHGWTLVHE